MLTSRPLRLGFPVLLLATAPLLPADGLYWESVSTGGPLPGERAAKTFAVPKKMKREEASGTFLVRLDKETIYFLNPKAKTYWEATFADLEKSVQGLADQKEQLKKSLEKLPPEQRALVEKQLGRQLGESPTGKDGTGAETPVVVQKTSDQRKIAGHSCARYVGKEGDKEVLVVWSTSEVKGFEALRKDWLEVMKRMAALNPQLQKGRAAALEKVEGFPLETDVSGIKTTVTKVEERATPDADFEVPADFTKTKSPLEGRTLPGAGGVPGKRLKARVPSEPGADPKQEKKQ